MDECTEAYDEKEFLEHIKTCESCCNAYNEIKRIKSELNNTEYLPLPENFHSELTDKLIKNSKNRKRKAIVKYSAVAACAALIFMTGAYMKDLYYMASEGSYAQSAASANGAENMSSGKLKSASGAMLQDSYNQSYDNSAFADSDYDSQTNTYKGKNGNITVRIESAKFSDAMEYIETLGTVVNQSESVNDITDSYVDTQSRLEVKEQEKVRLTELLNNAENISDIITIEGRLTEVISDIESYQAQLNAYDGDVDYSTINITVWEKSNDSIIPAKTDFTNKAVYNFKDSARTLFSGFEGIVLLIIKLWAPLAVVLAVAGVSVIYIKSKKNKKL